ncbi:MAG TPA: nicotinate (nicotinamide) nucleotide adenylyltransferase [Bacteroidia bacterium]|nr:nicotinate (nicotinamide) nucleotide adenylyltransferase [Bacteroidia bacterium]
MRIGLLFGTFNPVHTGHTIIASYMAEFTNLEEVWMVVSPHNPLKPVDSLLEENHRLQMVNLAIGGHKKIKASQVEFDLPKPSFTINTLKHLAEQHPQNEFTIIIGTDNLEIFKQWKSHEDILTNYEIYVYPRLKSDGGELINHPKIKLIDAPVIEISATFIRKCIKEKKDVRFMLPEKVFEYIREKHFYE